MIINQIVILPGKVRGDAVIVNQLYLKVASIIGVLLIALLWVSQDRANAVAWLDLDFLLLSDLRDSAHIWVNLI